LKPITFKKYEPIINIDEERRIFRKACNLPIKEDIDLN
jgi:hypothetical protein